MACKQNDKEEDGTMQKICRNCGQRVSEKARFCHKCGSTELKEDSREGLLLLFEIVAGIIIIIILWLAAQAK